MDRSELQCHQNYNKSNQSQEQAVTTLHVKVTIYILSTHIILRTPGFLEKSCNQSQVLGKLVFRAFFDATLNTLTRGAYRESIR